MEGFLLWHLLRSIWLAFFAGQGTPARETPVSEAERERRRIDGYRQTRQAALYVAGFAGVVWLVMGVIIGIDLVSGP